MKRLILPTLRVGVVLAVLTVSDVCAVAGRQANREGSTLNSKYDAMIQKAETYEKYKVIPTASLSAFWQEVRDTLSSYRQDINLAQAEIVSIGQTLKSTNDSLAVVNERLAASEEVNSEIAFLGLSFNKSLYNTLVWGLMGTLLVFMAVLYFSFKNAHVVTGRAKKDLAQVRDELESLRNLSNEKQVKLKRELQTALNQLDEVKRKVTAGR